MLSHLRLNLCLSGQGIFDRASEAVGDGLQSGDAVQAWADFRTHTVICPDCYPHVSCAGGLARIYRQMQPSHAEPEE